MCRSGWIVAVGSMLALCAGLARAEVRTVTDRAGAYRTFRVTKSGRAGVWTPAGRVEPGTALNPLGDRNRDLWPSVREATVAPHYPWAVWSRFDGTDYDLAWSRWSGTRWEPIRRLDDDGPSPGIDLDPSVQFDRVGRPFVVWWKNRGGTGSVYLSLFLNDRWMTPFRVTGPSVDARYPSMEVRTDKTLIVHYSTEEGLVEQIVLFSDPGTITDDVNPMDCVHLAGSAVLLERYSQGD